MQKQAWKVDSFCKWAGLEVNIDKKRKNKTAWTGIVRDNDALEKRRLKDAKAGGLQNMARMDRGWIPYLEPRESYVYLGTHINLTMDWRDHWESTCKKMREAAEATSASCAKVTQKLRLLEMVVRPIMRYSMSAVPFTWTQVHMLNGILMGAARRSCGLSRVASTGLMMADRQDFGVGLKSAHHTYAEVLLDTTMKTLNGGDDIGTMTRGLWAHHQNHLMKGGMDTLQDNVLARYPTMRAVVYLNALGIQVVDGEAGEASSIGEKVSSFEQAMIREAKYRTTTRVRSPVLKELLGSDFLPYYVVKGHFMGPLWKVGLHELEDLLDMSGKRVLTLAELRKRFPDIRLNQAHGKALEGLGRALKETNRVLPVRHQSNPRAGPIQGE